jgi:hypothetical protein
MNGWRLTGLLSVLLVLMSVLLAASEAWSVEGVRLVVRVTARTSLFLFLLAFTAVAWHLNGFFLTLCGSSAVSDGVAMGGHAQEIEMVARPRGEDSGCCAHR